MVTSQLRTAEAISTNLQATHSKLQIKLFCWHRMSPNSLVKTSLIERLNNSWNSGCIQVEARKKQLYCYFKQYRLPCGWDLMTQLTPEGSCNHRKIFKGKGSRSFHWAKNSRGSSSLVTEDFNTLWNRQSSEEYLLSFGEDNINAMLIRL